MTDIIKETATAESTEPTAMYGWVCPTCRRVFSPFTTMCPYCGGNHARDFVVTANTSEFVTNVTCDTNQPSTMIFS